MKNLRKKIGDLICESFSISFRFSVETIMENNKSPITEKRDFQNRNETLLLASFGTPDCQKSNARNKIDNFSLKN